MTRVLSAAFLLGLTGCGAICGEVAGRTEATWWRTDTGCRAVWARWEESYEMQCEGETCVCRSVGQNEASFARARSPDVCTTEAPWDVCQRARDGYLRK